MRRALCVLAAVAAFLGASVPGAGAASWPQIDSVDGVVQDADASRILFREFTGSESGSFASGPLAIKDRRTDAITQIAGLPGKPVRGHLTPYGALVETEVSSPSFHIELYDWRPGSSAVDLGKVWSGQVKVAGSFAAWKREGELSVRDLTAGTTTKVSSFAKTWDVADNGDVVFTDEEDPDAVDSLWRYRGGTKQLLAGATEFTRNTDPRTDGINVVWKQITNCCAEPDTSLQGYGPSGAFPLVNTTPAGGYQVADGWIAFTRGAGSSGGSSVWMRDQLGNETSVAGAGSFTIHSLGEGGQLLFRGSDGQLFIAHPGDATLSLGTTNRGGFSARLIDGRWYDVGGQLYRLSLTDAPSDGSETTLDSAPEGIVASTDADFTFSSTAAGSPTFECRLDAADWAPCTSPLHLSVGQGPHTFLVRSVEGGDVDPDPAAQMWTADTVTPVVTLSVPTIDGATGSPTPTLSGAAGQASGDDDHLTVEIFAGSAATGTPVQTFDTPRNIDTHGSQGFWSAPAQHLADGVYTARAHQSDNAGHTGYSAASTFRVDTQPPAEFALLSPADGGTWHASTHTVSWEPATDAGAGIDRYQVWMDGSFASNVEPDEACDADKCEFASLFPAPGSHTWLVKAVDKLDHPRMSETRSFTVDDSSAGDFELIAPADGEHTGDTTPTLSWQAAADAESGIDHYDVWVDSTRVATGVTGTELTLADALSGGPHTWRVDAINGADAVHSSAQRQFVVDLAPPQAALSASAERVLEDDGVTLDASGSSDADGGSVTRFEWDIDGDGSFDRDTGATPTTTAAYPVAGEMHPTVRVTDSVGLSATRSVAISVRPRPPDGPAGVSINGGDRFTNDPDVDVRVAWTPLSTGLLIANDGGFQGASPMPLAEHVAWTLDSSGSERLPRTIYVRFTGNDARETYQDDIILDETAPALLSARIARGKLRLRARDNVSGVSAMQITSNRRKSGAPQRYRRVTRVHKRSVYVRVLDGAGNWSRWKRAHR